MAANPQVSQQFPALKGFLFREIGQENIKKLSKLAVRQIKRGIILSLFQIINEKQFREQFAKYFNKPVDATILRRKLTQDHFMNAIYKLHIILDLKGICNISTGFHKKTRKEFYKVIANDLIKLGRIAKKIKILDIYELEKLEKELLHETKKSLAYLVHKTTPGGLCFVWRSERLAPDDLIHDLQIKLLTAIRWSYPFKDRAYIKNYSMRAVHNFAVNKAKWHNAAKRARLVKDQLGDWNNRQELLGDQIFSCDKTSDLEKQVFYSQLVRRKLIDKKILDLLSLQDQTNFISWVNNRYKIAISDVESLYEKIGRVKYLEVVAHFLGFTQFQFQKILEKLRSYWIGMGHQEVSYG